MREHRLNRSQGQLPSDVAVRSVHGGFHRDRNRYRPLHEACPACCRPYSGGISGRSVLACPARWTGHFLWQLFLPVAWSTRHYRCLADACICRKSSRRRPNPGSSRRVIRKSDRSSFCSSSIRQTLWFVLPLTPMYILHRSDSPRRAFLG